MGTRKLSRTVGRRLRGAPSKITPVRPPGPPRRRVVEQLWREFFFDPSRWWDTRHDKVNPRNPDFKHKEKKGSLWLSNDLNPPWVAERMATMHPGTVQVDLVTWNKRLARYVQAGQYEKTLKLFQQIKKLGLKPNKHTFVPALDACSGLRALEKGRQIHAQIILSGCESDTLVTNGLVGLYAKCGSMDDAWRVFKRSTAPNVLTWSMLILGYVKRGDAQKALELFREMQKQGVQPNSTTFVGLLNACARVRALDEGRRVHEEIVASGCESNMFVGNSLIDMYAKCGSLEDARRVFNVIRKRNVVTWSAMILAYVKYGDGKRALEIFAQMLEEGVAPNPFTFVGVLNACSSISALEQGKRIHKQIIDSGYESDVFVASAMVGYVCQVW